MKEINFIKQRLSMCFLKITVANCIPNLASSIARNILLFLLTRNCIIYYFKIELSHTPEINLHILLNSIVTYS